VTDLLWCMVAAIGLDFAWWLARVVMDQRRQWIESSMQYRAQMEGMAFGAGLDERDRREQLRRRLRLGP